MPEPAAPGAKRRVTQTSAAVQQGVQINGAQGDQLRIAANAEMAWSLTHVNSTTARPAAMAKASTTARDSHWRQSERSSRTAEMKSGS